MCDNKTQQISDLYIFQTKNFSYLGERRRALINQVFNIFRHPLRGSVRWTGPRIRALAR